MPVMKITESADGLRHPAAQRMLDYIANMQRVQDEVKLRKYVLTVLACHLLHGSCKTNLPVRVLNWMQKGKSLRVNGNISGTMRVLFDMLDEAVAGPVEPNATLVRDGAVKEELVATFRDVRRKSAWLSERERYELLLMLPPNIVENKHEHLAETIWWHYMRAWMAEVKHEPLENEVQAENLVMFKDIVQTQLAQSRLPAYEREMALTVTQLARQELWPKARLKSRRLFAMA